MKNGDQEVINKAKETEEMKNKNKQQARKQKFKVQIKNNSNQNKSKADGTIATKKSEEDLIEKEDKVNNFDSVMRSISTHINHKFYYNHLPSMIKL